MITHHYLHVTSGLTQRVKKQPTLVAARTLLDECCDESPVGSVPAGSLHWQDLVGYLGHRCLVPLACFISPMNSNTTRITDDAIKVRPLRTPQTCSSTNRAASRLTVRGSEAVALTTPSAWKAGRAWCGARGGRGQVGRRGERMHNMQHVSGARRHFSSRAEYGGEGCNVWRSGAGGCVCVPQTCAANIAWT